MNYTVTEKGALLPALWLTALSAAVGLFVWLLFSCLLYTSRCV